MSIEDFLNLRIYCFVSYTYQVVKLEMVVSKAELKLQTEPESPKTSSTSQLVEETLVTRSAVGYMRCANDHLTIFQDSNNKPFQLGLGYMDRHSILSALPTNDVGQNPIFHLNQFI